MGSWEETAIFWARFALIHAPFTGGSPTGITIDPSTVSHLWIVDSSSDRIDKFTSVVTTSPQTNASHLDSPQDISSPTIRVDLRGMTSAVKVSEVSDLKILENSQPLTK
jgi:hypothetical protein